MRLSLVRSATLGSRSLLGAIAKLIGFCPTWLADDDQACAFRVAMNDVRRAHVEYYGAGPASLAAEPNTPVPPKIMVQLQLALGRKVIAVEPGETAAAFIARIFGKVHI